MVPAARERGCGEEMCEEGRRGHMTVEAPGYGQQWKLSPTHLESRRRCKEADHVEREGVRAGQGAV